MPEAEPHHFSDYGFDPQITFFQVLEEAMKHKSETERSIDSIRFTLQKPVCKDGVHSKNKKRWWKNLFKWKWTHHRDQHHHQPKAEPFRVSNSGEVDVPYLSLGDLNKQQRKSTSALPVYL